MNTRYIFFVTIYNLYFIVCSISKKQKNKKTKKQKTKKICEDGGYEGIMKLLYVTEVNE